MAQQQNAPSTLSDNSQLPIPPASREPAPSFRLYRHHVHIHTYAHAQYFKIIKTNPFKLLEDLGITFPCVQLQTCALEMRKGRDEKGVSWRYLLPFFLSFSSCCWYHRNGKRALQCKHDGIHLCQPCLAGSLRSLDLRGPSLTLFFPPLLHGG